MNHTPPWWQQTQGDQIRQGDFLLVCKVPIFAPNVGISGSENNVRVLEYNCIVMTQSCDLENRKAPLVAVCPVFTISDYESLNAKYKEKGTWERVRRGNVEGLHMLASTGNSESNRESLVVNFREIYSLPIGYLQLHAVESGKRWRLQPPYLEHFSQAFARFFMRVGLPSSIPAFK